MSHRGPGEAWIPGIHGRTYSGGPQIAAPSMKLHPASHLLGSVLLASTPALAGDLFVDVSQTTGAGTGGSWADAFQGPLGLKDALAVAVAGDRIFVAQGTYLPTDTGARTQSFPLRDGVELYGGCVGTELEPDQRPPIGSAPTILSADLAGNDASGVITDNSYHVIRGFGVSASAVLDGFVVRGGFANGSGASNDRGGGILCTGGSNPTVRSCSFESNRCTFGGGAGYINGSSPTFTDCQFLDNIGGSYGGAFDMATASGVRFDRCTFIGNSAARAGALEIFASSGIVVTNCIFRENVSNGSGGGGGLWLGSGGSTQVVNCTIVENQGTSSNIGGLYNQGASVTLRNSILWGNMGPNGATNAVNQLSGAAAQYCLVQGGASGSGNLSSDPAFVDAASGDLRLRGTSPAVDAGTNAALPAGITLDAAGEPRVLDLWAVPNTGVGAGGVVDMGALEVQASIGEPVACTPNANSTGAPSNLEANGSPHLADDLLSFRVTGLPTGRFAYFVMAASSGSTPVASGVLCLAPPLVRFSGAVLNSGPFGVVEFSPSLAALPQNTTIAVGETWHFQLWHRDVGATSNFSDAVAVTWE